MSSFLGQHQNRLDPKKRVSVPAAYRAVLTGITGKPEMILRPSIAHPCIEAWPVTEFNDLEKTLKALDPFSEEYEDKSVAVYADAFPVEADKEGRILLPDTLVAYAGLTGAVVFMGLGTKFQIWEPAAAAARAVEARERTRLRNRAAPIAAPLAAGGG